MIKPAIGPVVVFRVPKFSVNATLEQSWETLKADIAISSPVFYDTIKDVKSQDLGTLPEKVFFTIWKYFNRARYRATPFGTFGAFGITTRSARPEDEPLKIEMPFRVHHFTNWPQKNELRFNYEELVRDRNMPVFTNSSYYIAHDTIRFIATAEMAFEISEIERNEAVLDILRACSMPTGLKEIATVLDGKYTPQDIYTLVMEMIGIQLLIPAVDPNIIGNDYFRRLGTELQGPTPYLISEVKVSSGTADSRKVKHLPELIELLRKIVRPASSASLQQFTDNFKRKFELQEVPLMEALDPETGVGYDELEQGVSGEFIKQFTGKKPGEQKGAKAAEDFFSAKILENNTSAKVISLESLQVDGDAPVLNIPNTMSVIATVADDLVFLNNIGGVTANALNGRFTLCSEEMLEFSKDIARVEAEANPEVIFFDVAYMSEANVDNINRRKQIYPRQLSILCYDTSAEPLVLNDILVSVKGNEIVLRSRSLNKRLIPKMASAYNFSRSDLSVFRLLCDLQHQGLQSQLVISLEKLFPNRPHYPRVQYRNLVVAPEMWRVQTAGFPKGDLARSSDAEMQDYLEKLGVSRYFKTGIADQTLCFDRHNLADIRAFKMYASKKGSFMVEEAVMSQHPAVVDQHNAPYLAQFIFNIQHSGTIYRAPRASVPADEQVESFFPPGSEWLYFELYCHPLRADVLLQGPVRELLESNAQHIKNWFFIRFTQYGNHIRFRIKLRDKAFAQQMMEQFAALLRNDLNAGLVSDIQVKTYKREIARYGSDRIGDVEAHFCADSRFVLQMLESGADEMQKYSACVRLMPVLAGCFEDPAHFEQAIGRVADGFANEHHLDAADFKKLNERYQEYRKLPDTSLPVLAAESMSLFQNSFIQVLNDTDITRRMQLCTDLFHMHVNRLFAETQRTHEMLIYYFIVKELKRLKAIAIR